MSASTYHAIEDLERQLDACVGRIQYLETHVRAEIDQQKEEMQKLRDQLQRARTPVSEPIVTPADDAMTAGTHAAALDAFADLLSGTESFDMPSALVFDDDPDYVDPFESVLPEVQYRATDAQDDVVNVPSAGWEAPIPGWEAPVDLSEAPAQDEPIAAEPPVAELGFTIKAELAETAAAHDAPAASSEASAEAELEGPADSPAWSAPVDPSVMSNFRLPAEAFTSEQEDVSPEPAAPEIESPRVKRAGAETPKQPKPLSEFDRLLDWSDFEVEGPDEPHDEAPSPPSGDGMTATHIPVRPTVRQERHDRPVTVTRRVPEFVSADSLDQKIGDDLTVITGIDAKTQEALRHIGVISLDEIASWHPADAQRIAAQLGTASDSEIFDVWVPEAQSALFDLFQQRLRTNRFPNLDEM